MKRGGFVTVAMAGDFGKSRPALVLQADQFMEVGTVTVLLVSTTQADAPLIRFSVHPNPQNGLHRPSQIMVDKAMSVKRERLGAPFGQLDDATMTKVERALALFLGFA